MLILSRRFRQSVVIGGRVKVTVVAIAPNHVELGIQAPQHIVVDREEIHLRKRNRIRAQRRPSVGARHENRGAS